MDFVVLQSVLQRVADWAVPLLLLVIPLYAMTRGVKVYETFVEGAREGFDIGVRIMPFLVAILVAIGIFRDVNGMIVLANLLSPITSPLNVSVEILTMAIVRPLSGSGAMGIMTEIVQTYGADSFNGMLASVLMGSTETTFYVLAVYFGAVNIRKTRHAVPAGLVGDIAGFVAAVTLCNIFFGHLIVK